MTNFTVSSENPSVLLDVPASNEHQTPHLLNFVDFLNVLHSRCVGGQINYSDIPLAVPQISLLYSYYEMSMESLVDDHYNGVVNYNLIIDDLVYWNCYTYPALLVKYNFDKTKENIEQFMDRIQTDDRIILRLDSLSYDQFYVYDMDGKNLLSHYEKFPKFKYFDLLKQ